MPTDMPGDQGQTGNKNFNVYLAVGDLWHWSRGEGHNIFSSV